MHHCYIVRCADDTLYCGYSTDVTKRIVTHNKGHGAKYTKHRLPVKLVYSESFELKSKALQREHQIKKMSRLQKLNLIDRSTKP